MTIKVAIAWLQSLEVRHGSLNNVYFDCPDCKKSFSPDTVETSAVHITATKK